MSSSDIGKFLIFGDSITEFCFDQQPEDSDKLQFALGPALQNRYRRRLEILHRGFSGYTSREAPKLARLIFKHDHDNKPESQQIKLAYIFFGTNDACHKGTNPANNQHVPIEQYIQNMTETIQLFKDRNIPTVIVTPGFHDQKMWDRRCPEDLKTGDFRHTETNRQYASALVDKCKELNVPTLNLWEEMNAHFVKTGQGSFLTDGIHYNGLGYKIFYDNLIKIISTNFPHLEPMAMPVQFPFRRDIKLESLTDMNTEVVTDNSTISEFQMSKFLLFGDSITEYCYDQFPLNSKEVQNAKLSSNYNPDDPDKSAFQSKPRLAFSLGAKIDNDYVRRMQILHRGYAGYNTDQAVNIARGILAREHDGLPLQSQIKLAYVFFGSNDYRMTSSEVGYAEGIPKERFQSNMEKILDMFHERGIKTIVITPAVHDRDLWDMVDPDDVKTNTFRTNALGIEFGDIIKKVAHERDMPVVDLYHIMVNYIKNEMGKELQDVEFGGLGDLLIDGIHFTDLSYRLMYNNIMDAIKTNWPEWDPENVPYKFPYYADLTAESFAGWE